MNAKLICSDGTEIAVSKETEENMREKFGQRKEWEDISLCHLQIGMNTDNSIALLGWLKKPKECICDISYLRKIIKALEKAIRWIETHKGKR